MSDADRDRWDDRYRELGALDEPASPFPRVLAAGGVFVFVQPTVRNLERHDKPSRRHLLGEGELAALVQGLRVERCDEAWHEQTDRHEAVLIARRHE